MPDPNPSANMATSTAAKRATAGVPMNTRNCCSPFSSSLMVSSAIARASIKITGSVMLMTAAKNPGR